MILPQGFRGYALEKENRDFLETAPEPSILLKNFKKDFPKFNSSADPLSLIHVRNQLSQGSCQGASLSQVFSICFWLAYARYELFSMAAGYYVAQEFDGLRGDVGSTLSGGNKVATQHGMCLEKDWPYPVNYNPRKPPNITFPYKLAVSRPFKDVDEMWEWLKEGLPVQIGVIWDDSCNRSLVDNYNGSNNRSGGHATVFWTLQSPEVVNNINSWGSTWDRDGIHQWTKRSVDRALKNRWNVFIGYSPEKMVTPPLPPVQV